jgi:hypothetical protein
MICTHAHQNVFHVVVVSLFALSFIGIVIMYLYREGVQKSPTMFCGIATSALIESLFQIFILDKIIILRVRV